MEEQEKKKNVKDVLEQFKQKSSEKNDDHQENDIDDAHAQLVQKLTDEIADLKDKLLRQMADSENVRVRSAKMLEEAKDYAIFSFCKELVHVMDNLSRSLEHLPNDIGDDMKNIVAGIEMTKSELESVFSRNKLESIMPQTGDKFDYNLHHAISQIVTNESEPGTIVNTMQTGYKIKDRLIRPAAVTVAKSE